MSFVSLAEAAVMMGIPVRVLRELCERGMIDGAVRFGRIWTVPETVCVPGYSGINGAVASKSFF